MNLLAKRTAGMIAALAIALLALMFAGNAIAFADDSPATVSLGSASTQFEVGKSYSVPIGLKKAADLTQDSAAAAMLTRSVGALSIAEDGTATVKLYLGSVSYLGLVGWGSNVRVYQDNGYGSTHEAQAATVLKTTTDDEGNTVPTVVELTIPQGMMAQDGVYLKMYVNVMDSDVDAYLTLDYANAQEGASYTYTTEVGTANVRQFGSYYVHAQVTVTDDAIAGVRLFYEADDFSDTAEGELNMDYCELAIEGMTDSFNGISADDYDAIEAVDVVAGATYSSRAYRDAVVDALGGTVVEEVIPDAPDEAPAPGTYSIMITDIADGVSHSVIGRANSSEKQPATLVVAEDGSMTLHFTMVSGTSAEPLYALAFNGYYDEEGQLTTAGASWKTEDVKDYDCVTDVVIPLASTPSQTARTNVYLYVPAMKNLNGEVSGFVFVNGHFNADTTIVFYWDTLTAIDGDEALDGWFQNGDGTLSYYEDGIRATGWKKLTHRNDGDVAIAVMEYYYFGTDGIMRTGWQKVGGSYYYLGADGAMQTGWLKSGSSWYYLKGSGAMATGWCKVGGSYYYFKSSGAMATGWLKSGSTYYYLKSSGAMATGWQKVGGSYYYFASNGKMYASKWLQSGKKWYWFKASGKMAASETLTINGKKFTFLASGALK